MNILINCSNIKAGGGLQVADSICRQLHRFTSNRFFVVYTNQLRSSIERIEKAPNVSFYQYNLKNSWRTLLQGRDTFLDSLVNEQNIEAVLTVFGPSRWQPRAKHLCGFARAQLLLTDSPYYQHIGIKERLKFRLWAYYFRKSSKVFYTENPYITEMLPTLLGKDVTVYSVTNYYNQVFDEPEHWSKRIELPAFEGATILSISSAAPHKNYQILAGIIDHLEANHPEFKFRFVVTQSEQQMPFLSERQKSHVVFLGKIDIAECPHLYAQSDIMFMPTLMECFTATYPEAMRMEVPIVTTDLEFAHGLCRDAACYYEAMDAADAASKIYKVATDAAYATTLINNGRRQLKEFDDYNRRAEKLISIIENL